MPSGCRIFLRGNRPRRCLTLPYWSLAHSLKNRVDNVRAAIQTFEQAAALLRTPGHLTGSWPAPPWTQASRPGYIRAVTVTDNRPPMFDMDIQWSQVIFHLYQLGLAFALSLPVAWDRESRSRGAGLRTFPLVSVAACAYMLIGIQVYEGSAAEARVMYGIITGIGFIGGGAILKNRDQVVGTATAASIWNTGAIGIAVAYGRYEIALLLSLINFLVFLFSRPFKRQEGD